MTNSNHEIEEPTLQSAVPQSIPMETEVNSSAPATKDYIINTNDVQEFSEDYEFFDGRKLQPYNVAKCILDNFRVISIDNMLYIYNEYNRIYLNDTKIIESIIMQLVPKIKLSDIKAVLYDLSRCAPVRELSDEKYVVYNNCILDTSTLQVVTDFTPEKYIITTRVYANYVPDVVSANGSDVKFVKSFGNTLSCGNRDLAIVYLEVLGYCLVRSYKFQLRLYPKGWCK